MTHPISWFEIPALDFARARSFYETIFGVKLTEHAEGPNTLGVFPFDRANATGGCILEGPMRTPTNDGVIIYLNAGSSLDDVLNRVKPAGGEVVSPRAVVPNIGYSAHIKDTEGNRIGLFAVK